MGERLTRKAKDEICERVYSRFPAMRGVNPSIRRQQAQGQDRFLLCFETAVSLDDGARMSTTVRVVANAEGKIIKMTSSR
jgi:hypothetical protein